MTLSLNGSSVLSCTLHVPETGVWTADVTLDETVPLIAPRDRVVLVIGDERLLGRVDATRAGLVGGRQSVVIVGGSGGWGTHVDALAYHSDAGVRASDVYASTGATVEEIVQTVVDAPLGPHFVRAAGRASSVLTGTAWHVRADGVTIVGPWPSSSPVVDVLEWSPDDRRAVLAGEAVVWPGAALTSELTGSVTVRESTLHVDVSGARSHVYVATSASAADEPHGNRLARAIASLARSAVAVEYMQRHDYRVVVQGLDGRVTVQAVRGGAAVPELLVGVPVWPSAAGVAQRLAPGTLVHVAFGGLGAQSPVVVACSPDSGIPLETKINAIQVTIGAGTAPVARASASFVAWVTAITTAINALAPGSAIAPLDVASVKLFSE
jgi:hypothetical protein